MVDASRVDSAVLTSVSAAILRAVGLSAADARSAADVLVAADLRGVDSHGAVNLLPAYVDSIRRGGMRPSAETTVIRETPATATLDGGGGLGVVTAPEAMELAIRKAGAVGVGVVVVRNSRHLGMAGYHAMLALDHDMVGMCSTSAGPTVLPTFGAEPRLGTNPIAVAAPCSAEPHFVFDGATSAIAGNRINTAHRSGTQLPGGVIADADGHPIREPSVPPPSFRGVALLPLGSAPESGSHKGYGLASVVEIMATILSGSELMMRLPQGCAAHTLMAFDLAAFGDVGSFKRSMDDFTATLRATRPVSGQERVLVAGEREWETRLDRIRNGVPIQATALESFDGLCRAVGVAPLSAQLGDASSIEGPS